MTHPRATFVVLSWALLFAEACGKQVVQSWPTGEPAAEISELWQEPADLERRDLRNGAGGASLRPSDQAFVFIAEDRTGWSPGFDVRDASGVTWSVKLGPEAQTEVVASRVLWAIGYHQPPTYYLDNWTMQGGPTAEQPAGRFRPDLPTHRAVADWSWYENPFVGSRPFRGLIVANLLLNSWDWKTSNNKIYRLEEPVRGASRLFVVRDLGASLGKTSYPAILKWFRLRGFGQGTRNDIAGFEEQGFVRGVDEDGRVIFDYRGIYNDIVDTVTPEDVRWTCALLSRLTDRQWDDTFAAAGYPPEIASRYVTKIKAKIAEGLAVGQS